MTITVTHFIPILLRMFLEYSGTGVQHNCALGSGMSITTYTYVSWGRISYAMITVIKWHYHWRQGNSLCSLLWHYYLNPTSPLTMKCTCMSLVCWCYKQMKISTDKVNFSLLKVFYKHFGKWGPVLELIFRVNTFVLFLTCWSIIKQSKSGLKSFHA